MTSISVETKNHSYPIHFSETADQRLLADVNAILSAGRKAVVVTDEQVWAHLEEVVHRFLPEVPVLILPAGETTKSMANVERVCEFCVTHHLDRQGVLFAFGGGVIGDLTGYAAASFLRGIDFYQIPTTLLAMVDSSVGGKTGVNLPSGKNLVGAFHQPQAVYIHPARLRTLPAKDFNAGMAEVIKSGLLGDRDLWEKLQQYPKLTPDSPELPAIIAQTCQLKATVVQADEKEQAASGGRALLNLGHTFAHAIENVAGYGDYLHGEAVAIGLVLAARMSEKMGWIRQETVNDIIEVIEKYDLPIRLHSYLPINELIDAMYRDKKVSLGNLRFVALRAAGEAFTTRDIPEDLLQELWISAETN